MQKTFLGPEKVFQLSMDVFLVQLSPKKKPPLNLTEIHILH